MAAIIDILTSSTPALPDYCRLGNRIFITDGMHTNRVVMDAEGTSRPMGAREQLAPLGVEAEETASGPLPYGGRVTYGLRRVLSAKGLDVPGGLIVQYIQLPAYTGSADPEPTLAATMTITPYEFPLPDGCAISYEVYRSRPENYQILYRCAVLTQDEVEALEDAEWTDMTADGSLEALSINLEADGMDLTIPPCRFIRAWRGSLVCGGFLRSEITVTGTTGATAITVSPSLSADDIGCYITIPGEPYTYQIIAADGEGNATIDTALANDHNGTVAIRWRDDDVIYVSRPLPGNIEVYSAENGRVITNAGADNAITGIASHGSYAYIFRRDTVEILTGSPEKPALEPFPGNPPGCRSHATIVDSLSPCVLYYAGANGVWQISGSEARRVSAPVDPFIQNGIDHSQDDRCHAVYDPATSLYWLFLFRVGWQDSGVRMPDTYLCLDLATGAWARGELYAGRSGLFRDESGEMVPVFSLPGRVARLGIGDADGGVCRQAPAIGGARAQYGDDDSLVSPAWITLDPDILPLAQLDGLLPGAPIHVWNRAAGQSSMSAVRRMVSAVYGSTVEIYGDWPEDMGDFAGLQVAVGAIRWAVTTPTIALAGDFDKAIKLETVAIAHDRAAYELPVDVSMETVGEMKDRDPDAQKWRIDFSSRSLSRLDGKATGLRGSAIRMKAEGPAAPAAVLAIRIETKRSAR
jgi:hypothetical protein